MFSKQPLPPRASRLFLWQLDLYFAPARVGLALVLAVAGFVLWQAPSVFARQLGTLRASADIPALVPPDDLLALLGLFSMMGAVVLVGSRLLRPSHASVERWIARNLAYLERRAMVKCDLLDFMDGEERDLRHLPRPPVVLTGLELQDVGVDFGIASRNGVPVAFTPMHVTVLNLGVNQVFAYRCAFDVRTGRYLREETDEYFYQDVVSVATRSRELVVDERRLTRRFRRLAREHIRRGKLVIPGAEQFVLTTSGGTAIEAVIAVPLTVHNNRLEIAEHRDRADRVVTALRKVLRELKKSGLEPPVDPAPDAVF